MSGLGSPGDAEHERALMRSFELRHPLLALSLRMVRNRPITGSIMAIAFVAASLILFEGIKLADQRISTWINVNYAGQWMAHDREQAIRRTAAAAANRLVHEDAPITLRTGQHVTVYFERSVTAKFAWQGLPDQEKEDLESDGGRPLHDIARFTLPPGDELSVFRIPDGTAAVLTIKGTDYVLAHAFWAEAYPGDLKEADRKSVCSHYEASHCSIYGYITKQEFDALGFSEAGAPAASPPP